jgi:hypothetical protein
MANGTVMVLAWLNDCGIFHPLGKGGAIRKRKNEALAVERSRVCDLL